MTFRIEFTDGADLEVQDIIFWIIGRSPENAARWQDGFEKVVQSLAEFPTRCPLAPENDQFDREVRQILYGAYRILYMLVDDDADGSLDTVRILHVRHGARKRFGEE